jgi:hypothetical protein
MSSEDAKVGRGVRNEEDVYLIKGKGEFDIGSIHEVR